MKNCFLLIALFGSLARPQRAQAELADFAGEWRSVNSRTSGFSRMELTVTNTSVTLHLFGACEPTECDLGEIPAIAYGPTVASDLASKASALTADYVFSFVEIRVIVHRLG